MWVTRTAGEHVAQKNKNSFSRKSKKNPFHRNNLSTPTRILSYRLAGKSYVAVCSDARVGAACRLLAPLHSTRPSFIPLWLLFVTKMTGLTSLSWLALKLFIFLKMSTFQFHIVYYDFTQFTCVSQKWHRIYR